jgi:UrcA family protein
MTLSKTITTIIASTAALSLLPAMAAVKADPVEKTQTVSIKGFDLTNIVDAQALLQRIESASRVVCRLNSNRETLRERQIRRSCEQEATANAVKALDAPVVTAVMEDKL